MGKNIMNGLSLDNLPEEVPEEFELELYKSCWALRIDGDLYVFPPETTKTQAEEVLRKAYNLYRTKFN